MTEPAPPVADAVDVDVSETLPALIEQEDRQRLEQLVREAPSGDIGRAVAMLDGEQQTRLLTLLTPESAAYLVEQLADAQAADLLEELPAEQAAAIVDEMPSDQQADLLGELDQADAEAIIANMAPEEASDVRLLSRYEPDTAGGLMVTEYLAFFESMTVDDVVQDVRANAEKYLEYDVQYMYVIDSGGRLKGVVRLRDLVLARPSTAIADIMIREPRRVSVDATLDELEEFFDAHHYYGVPVVDHDGRLVGIVRRGAVEEARADRADRTLLRFGGIIGGEELRTMPMTSRAARRLAFLTPNIFLNLIAVSVIAFFEPTIAKVTALAIFLPVLSDMSGCSGNQAVAVSMRELSLGLVRPSDTLRTLGKEVSVGAINGIVLGALLLALAYLMRGDLLLGAVVGAALAANSVIAVAVGGTVPLLLKGLKLDPAMASGPILTTVTDLCGFFFALALATAAYAG